MGIWSKFWTLFWLMSASDKPKSINLLLILVHLQVRQQILTFKSQFWVFIEFRKSRIVNEANDVLSWKFLRLLKFLIYSGGSFTCRHTCILVLCSVPWCGSHEKRQYISKQCQTYLQNYVPSRTYLLMIATFSYDIFIIYHQVKFVPSLSYPYSQSFQLS